jgi:hypothetical protein
LEIPAVHSQEKPAKVDQIASEHRDSYLEEQFYAWRAVIQITLRCTFTIEACRVLTTGS